MCNTGLTWLRKTAWVLSLMIVILGWWGRVPAYSATAQTVHCVVVVSLKIRPYMDAVQGIQTRFQEMKAEYLDVYFLDADFVTAAQRLTSELKDKPIDLVIAVGPEAMHYVWSMFTGQGTIKLFCMVLDPEKIIRSKAQRCGVPLNIAASIQLREFTRNLPFIKRIGLVYNPANNANFGASARTASQTAGLELVSLKITRRSQLLPVLRSHLMEIDALWVIPDRTVVSESLIPFIIKEAMANNVAVLGYNRFFVNAGAAISLVRDYEIIGRQTADMAFRMIAGKQGCQLEEPYFNILVNPHVLKTLGYPDDAVDPTPDGQEQP